MIDAVTQFLRCPFCHRELRRGEGVLACPEGHSFDLARQGYVSMLGGPGRAKTADSALMVSPSEAILGAGHYLGIEQAVCDQAERLAAGTRGGCVVDLGAGTGHYLSRVVGRVDRPGLALDISKFAMRRAARADPRIGAVCCDAWGDLPVASDSAAIALSIFAPRNGPELTRVLRKDGGLVVITPTAYHLQEIIGRLGMLNVDPRKPERLERSLGPGLEEIGARLHEQTIHLEPAEIRNLVDMGPSAWHTDPGGLSAEIERLPNPMWMTVSVTVSSYRVISGGDDRVGSSIGEGHDRDHRVGA